MLLVLRFLCLFVAIILGRKKAQKAQNHAW
jgi:hypothetical protein